MLPRWLTALPRRWFARTASVTPVLPEPPAWVTPSPDPWTVAELRQQRERIEASLSRSSAVGIVEQLQTLWSRPAPAGQTSHIAWRDAGAFDDTTQLHKAVDALNLDAINALLTVGADPNLPDRRGHSVLGAAVHNLRRSHGADPASRTAYHARLMAVVNRLLEVGADPNGTMGGLPYGRNIPVLFDATLYGPDALVERLLDAGADPRRTDENGDTLLGHIAGNNPGAARFLPQLIARGAEVNARDAKGWTPLLLAAMYHNPVAAQVLLDQGADRGMRGPKGETLRATMDLFEAEHQMLPRNQADQAAIRAWWEGLELRQALTVDDGSPAQDPAPSSTSGRRRL